MINWEEICRDRSDTEAEGQMRVMMTIEECELVGLFTDWIIGWIINARAVKRRVRLRVLKVSHF